VATINEIKKMPRRREGDCSGSKKGSIEWKGCLMGAATANLIYLFPMITDITIRTSITALKLDV
jgi:hypothetical protein